MTKRSFRQPSRQPSQHSPSYPTLDDFDRSSRRGFLAKLGAAIAGAGGLALLASCGERVVGGGSDLGIDPTGGDPIQPDARVDTKAKPDEWPLNGGASAPDSRRDLRKPDAKTLAGDAVEIDARIDNTPGEAPMMDARIDEEIPQPTQGKVAPMDARIDQGSCGTP